MLNLLNSWCPPHLSHSRTFSPEAPKADLCSSARAPPRLPHKTRAPRFLKTLPAIGRIRRFLQSKLGSEIIHMLNHVTHPFSIIFSMSRCITLSNPTIFRRNWEDLEDLSNATQLIVTLTRPLLLKRPLVILVWCVLWPGFKSGWWQSALQIENHSFPRVFATDM